MHAIKKLFSSWIIILLFIQASFAADPIWTTAFGFYNGVRFTNTYGIALDANRKIYIVDYGSHKAFILNNDYTSYMELVAGAGGFYPTQGPFDIAVRADGKTYVSDIFNNRVQVFDNAGIYSNIILGGSGGFDRTAGIAFDSGNNIYVSDIGHNIVHMFDSAGTFLRTFPGGAGGFSTPNFIAIDPADNIYVSDNGNGRIQIFDNNRNYVRSIGSVGTGNGQFQQPAGIALDTNNNIYVADYNNYRIQIFDNSGTFLGKIGSNGAGRNMFNRPTGIKVDNLGKIYVSDYSNRRIAVLFYPLAWTSTGTSTLGSLNLNQNLTLDSGKNLEIKQIANDVSAGNATSDGKLTISNSATLTSNTGSSISAVSLALSTGTLAVNQDMTLNVPLALTGTNNNINVGPSSTLTFGTSAVISGTGGFSKGGDGNFVINSSNNYSGTTSLNGGITTMGNAAAFSSGGITIGNGATLQAGINLPSLSNQLTMNGSVTIDTNGFNITPTQAFTTSSSYSLTKAGSGNLTLSFVNSPTATNLTGGTTVLNIDGALGSGDINMTNSATLKAGADLTLSNLSLTDTPTLDTQTHNVDINGSINGTGPLTKEGSGKANINSGGNGYSGGTNLNAGTLSISDNAALGSGDINTASSTILEATGSSDFSLDNVINGGGSLTKNGINNVSVTGINSYSGGTNLDAGSITINNSNALGSGDINTTSSTILEATGSSDFSLDNVINGGGSVTKNGIRSVSLNKANSYSGGTNLYAGELALNDEQALGTGALNMANNTILKVNGDFILNNIINLAANSTINIPNTYDTTLNQIIGNPSSSLIKGGTGNLNVPSSSNHLGSTQINNGIISLINATLGQNVTIGISGKLKGVGTILGNLINSGIVSPGFSPGIIQVTGNYTPINGTLQITISPSASPVAGVDYSQLAVTGTSDLAGSTLVVDADGGSYTEGTTYDILTSSAGVNGQFSNYTLNMAGPYVAPLTYRSNGVSLIIQRSYIPPIPNQHSLSNVHASDLAHYIDSLTVMSAEFLKILDVLYDLSSDDLGYSLRSMAPNRNLTANYISQNVTSLIHSIHHKRVEIVRENLFADEAKTSFNMESKNLLPFSTKGNLLHSITDNLDNNILRSDKQYVWITPFGQFTQQKTTNHGRGYEASTGGIIIGYDQKLSDTLIRGISLGYYHSKFDHYSNGGKDNKIKSGFTSIYSSKKLGKVDLSGSLLIAYNNNHLNRQINITNLSPTIARSKHKSYELSPAFEIGYKIQKANYQITPFFSTEYSMLFEHSYTEKDAGALNMQVKARQNHLFSNELGIKVRKAIKLKNDEEAILKAKLSYINKKRSKSHNKISARFTEQSFRYSSSNYNGATHLISPGVEIELKKENGLTVGGSYNGEFNKSIKIHEAILKMGMLF